MPSAKIDLQALREAFPQVAGFLQGQTETIGAGVWRALSADIQPLEVTRSVETARDAYMGEAQAITRAWTRQAEDGPNATADPVSADGESSITDDAAGFKAGALKNALDCIGTDDPDITNFFKDVISVAKEGKLESNNVTKKRLLEACELVDACARKLVSATGRLQTLSMPVIPVQNEDMHIVMTSRLSQLTEEIEEVGAIAQTARKTFDRNISGKFALTSAPQRVLLFWLVDIWRDTGREVTTTTEGEFATFLSWAFEAVYGRPRNSASDLLSEAKRIAEVQKNQSREDRATIKLHVQLSQRYTKQLRTRALGQKI